MQSTCPYCGQTYTHLLNDTWLIVCSNCSHEITNVAIKDPEAFNMPDDWSAIQIGTTGRYKGQSFTITGRIRFQMKNDFRNLWCARYDDKTIWIGQSLESIGFFTPPFAPYPYQFENLRAGVFVEFTDKIKLKCEMLESCVDIRYEGEVLEFPFPNADVVMFQASNTLGNTVLIFSNRKGRLHFLWGELMLVNGVSLENVRTFTEWEALK
jgi:hypothetical protein